MRHRIARLAHLCLLGISLLLAGCGGAAEHHGGGAEEVAHAPGHEVQWGYEEDNGPAVWADLDPGFALCGTGTSQSPIDLTNVEAGSLPDLFLPTGLRVIGGEHAVDVENNGHSVQFSYDRGDVLVIGDVPFESAQFHFHAPSEHTVDGRHFPMEMHVVHLSPTGVLAGLGVLIEEGAHNAAFEPLWGSLPETKGAVEHLEGIQVGMDELFPADRQVYRYLGSLTTPPCTEGGLWFVFVEPSEKRPMPMRSRSVISAAWAFACT